jgi:hypothetical protein
MNMDDPKLLPLLKKMAKAIQQTLTENGRITQIVEAIRKEGFKTNVSVETSVFLQEIETTLPLFPDSEPLVKENGDVAASLFDLKDEEFLKNFKIKITDPPP